jgi:predicted DNA-binding protein
MKTKKRKRRGRPPTGQSPQIICRVSPELLARIAEVAKNFQTQSAALREALERGLAQIQKLKLGN